MPYISTEDVARRRKLLKAALPEFKFSVTRDGYSGIRVSILAGPIDIREIVFNHYNNSVVYYYITNAEPSSAEYLRQWANDYADRYISGHSMPRYTNIDDGRHPFHKADATVKAAMNTILDIVSKGRVIEYEDADYGNVPNFYFDLAIGKYDKPYEYRP